jgi:hypothetical protein
MTLNLSSYPQCAKHLHFQRCRLDEQGFTAYWAAACVAEDFKDKDLTEFGGFDFDDRSDENGYRQLGRLEEFMAHRRRITKQGEDSDAFLERRRMAASDGFERVKAFLGAYGVKTGKIASDDEFWAVAEVLWPGRIQKPAVATFSELLKQITAITKQARKSVFRLTCAPGGKHERDQRRRTRIPG